MIPLSLKDCIDPNLIKRKKPRISEAVKSGADNGARTRDPNLGKVVLYQLSHVRKWWAIQDLNL